MIGLAVLLAGAALGLGLARWLRLPATPLLLAAGAALGAAGVLPEAALLQDALVLGVGFLLFAVGSELDLRRVGRYRRLAVRVGLVQFVVLAAASVLAALALGFAWLPAVYIALAMAASSTLVVTQLLNQRRQTFEPFGRMVIGVLLLQDLLVVVLASVVLRAEEGLLGMALGLLATLALVGLAYALQRWAIPRLVVDRRLDGEATLLLALALLFGFVGLAWLLGLPLVTGAFLAGVAFARVPVSGFVQEQLQPVTDFFLPLFFTALGGLMVVPSGSVLTAGLVLTAVMLVLTPVVVALVAERWGLSARASLEGGLLLSQTSEFSLVVGLLAYGAGAIGPDVFSVIALVTGLTMVATPFLSSPSVVWRLLHLHPGRRPEARPAPRDHILLLGCGPSGLPLLETLFLAGYDVLVVDDDPVVVRDLRENGVPVLRGEATDPEVLEAAGARQARAVVAMIRRPADMAAVIPRLDGVPVFVRVFTDQDAEAVELVGGTPVRYAEAAADAFLAWLETSPLAAPTAPETPPDVPSGEPTA